MVKVLPTFRGYIVDKRLREFRRVKPDKTIEFIPFDSPEGLELLEAWEEEVYGPAIYAETLEQAVADGVLVAVFENRWLELTGGKPLVATRAVHAEFSAAALLEVWNEYVQWRKRVEPTLKEEDRLFKAKMNDKTIWVLEDAQAFTILFPEDY